MSQEKNQIFFEICFEECQRMPNYCTYLTETLCYLHNEDDLYLVIPNRETNFIHNNQYFIHWRNAIGKGGIMLHDTLIGAPFQPHPLSLSHVLRGKQRWWAYSVVQFWMWHGGAVMWLGCKYCLWFYFIFLYNALNLGFMKLLCEEDICLLIILELGLK